MQLSEIWSFKFSVVIQNEALVFFANVLYFFEWKNEIQPLLAELKSLISITSASKFSVDEDADRISIISLILNGPWFEKKRIKHSSFLTSVKNLMLSTNIANYFLSTMVADHIASAINLLSTKAWPLYFQTLPCDLIAWIFR